MDESGVVVLALLSPRRDGSEYKGTVRKSPVLASIIQVATMMLAVHLRSRNHWRCSPSLLLLQGVCMQGSNTGLLWTFATKSRFAFSGALAPKESDGIVPLRVHNLPF